MHYRWVSAEMPHLLEPSFPAESLLGLMFPRAVATSAASANPEPVVAEAQVLEVAATTSQGREVAVDMTEATTTTAEATTTTAETTTATAEANTTTAEQTTATAGTETAVAPSEEAGPVFLQPPSSTRSLAAMSAITLTPPTSYGSRSTPPTSSGSRMTSGRSVHTSTTNPATSEPTMEVIVEQ